MQFLYNHYRSILKTFIFGFAGQIIFTFILLKYFSFQNFYSIFLPGLPFETALQSPLKGEYIKLIFFLSSFIYIVFIFIFFYIPFTKRFSKGLYFPVIDNISEPIPAGSPTPLDLSPKVISPSSPSTRSKNSNLIAEAHSSENYKLRINMIPKQNWGKNLRTFVPKKWKELSEKALQRTEYKCDICERAHKHLEVNEVWNFDVKTLTQRLVALQPLCSICHKTIHIGNTIRIDKKLREHCARHLAYINNISYEKAEEYISYSLNKTKSRNTQNWKIEYKEFLKSFTISKLPIFNQKIPDPPNFVDEKTIFTIYPHKTKFKLNEHFENYKLQKIRIFIKESGNNKCNICNAFEHNKIYPVFHLKDRTEHLVTLKPICSLCFKSKYFYVNKNPLNSKLIKPLFNHIKKVNSWDDIQTKLYLEYIQKLYAYLNENEIKNDLSFLETLKP